MDRNLFEQYKLELQNIKDQYNIDHHLLDFDKLTYDELQANKFFIKCLIDVNNPFTSLSFFIQELNQLSDDHKELLNVMIKDFLN